MFQRMATLTVLTALLAVLMAGPSMAVPAENGPKLGLSFTELPPTVPELRFAFACPDGLEVEVRWIAENVGDVAPPNSEIARLVLVTKGPLNLARFTRPTNGWPLGLYRLELRHEGKVFHTVRYVIEDLDTSSK